MTVDPHARDALVSGVLIEAKAAGEVKPRSIYDLTSDDPFIYQHSRKVILAQVDRQLRAAAQHGLKIEWRVADKRMSDAIDDFFVEQQIPIAVRHMPYPSGAR